jgi:hypothetical protein
MKRDKLVPFALGFLAGVLFMLLAGGTASGVLTYTMYRRALVEREHAAAAEQEALDQRKLAEEQLQSALREAERQREKP